MRKQIVFVALALMLLALVGSLATRTRVPHAVVVPADAAVEADAGAPPSPALSASELPRTAADAGPARLLTRPLRVVSLGWEGLVPTILAQKGGAGTLQTAGLELSARGVDKVEGVEAALGRGGEDADGADVVILPLPTFAAAYERLRALSPEIFFVVGWSEGRHAVLSAKGPVSPSAREWRVAGGAGEASTYLGLAALDFVGIAADRIKLVAPGTKVDDGTVATVERTGTPLAGKPWLTTADASRLIPLVAVSQRGTIERHGAALVAWARSTLEARRTLESDAAAAARVVAATQGAPDAVELLRRLGDTSLARLADNVRTMGLAGRGAVTLDALFSHAWRLWRGVGVLTTPPPDGAPIATTVAATLVRTSPSLVEAPPTKPRRSDGRPKVLLTHRFGEGAAKVDETAMLRDVGFLAGVFERAALRLTVRGADAKRTARLIDAAQGQFGFAEGRVAPGQQDPGTATSVVEVLEVP